LKIRFAHFVFQLVAIRPINNPDPNAFRPISKYSSPFEFKHAGGNDYEVTEVEVVSLITKPTVINYQYKGGSQNLPMPGGYSADEGGVIGTTIQISGSSGVAPRRDGMRMVGGWERLKAFREKIFKLSHTIDERQAAEILYATSDVASLMEYEKAKQIIGSDVVYGVNFYDFWNDEQYSLDIKAFNPSTQARLGSNTQYSISMIILGKPIKTKTHDTLLMTLQGYDWVENQIEAMAGKANAWLDLSDSVGAKIAGTVAFMGEGLLDTMDVGSEALEGVLQILPEITSTYTGGAFSSTGLTANRRYSRFMDAL